MIATPATRLETSFFGPSRNLTNIAQAGGKMLALLLMAVAMAGCVVVEAQQKKEEMLRKADIELNKAQILMLTGDLSQPYKKLGDLTYTEPFSPDAIDTNHINERLRQMAIAQYQDDVDAIIHISSDSNDEGTFVTVKSEAVEILGACSYCRHKVAAPAVAETNPADRVIEAPKFDVGDTWVTRINGKDGKIYVVSISNSELILNWFGHTNTYTPDGNFVSGYFGHQNGSFKPDLGTLEFPLKAGKKWSINWDLKTSYGVMNGTTHGEALNWEEISTAAGTLNTLKLKVDYRTSAFGVSMTCWYSPEVKALAKCRSSDPDMKDVEVVSYQPASSTASR